jgi:hypothetical protein
MVRLEGEVGAPDTTAYRRRESAIERLGWSAGALVLVAAALGVFGDGPFARVETAPSTSCSPC